MDSDKRMLRNGMRQITGVLDIMRTGGLLGVQVAIASVGSIISVLHWDARASVMEEGYESTGRV